MPKLYTPVICAIVSAAFMVGCSSMQHSNKEPPSAVVERFDGLWSLDRQASDDVRARLKPLFERDEKRWRRNAERFEDAPPREREGRGDEESFSNMHWLQGERQKEAQMLISLAMPATQLEIHASPTEVRIANNKGEGTRVFKPGESVSLFVAAGGFNVTSAWQENGFTIDSRGEGENTIRINEHYMVTSSGELEERLQLRLPNVGKQVFRIVYRRGPS